MTDSEEDLFEIIEDDDDSSEDRGRDAWVILIVDDDEEVHQATRYALNSISILGKSLCLLHAYSAAEAKQILTREKDIAVIFLDVVMESNDAGLKLVGEIRDDLELSEVRIILRTGQPGYAPETEIITAYDINDYRAKNELTQTRLLTSLTSAIRSYKQIKTISTSRQGLRQIISATSDLLSRDGLSEFASGVITQLSSFFSLPLDGLIAVRVNEKEEAQHINIIAAGERYRQWVDHELAELTDEHIRREILEALNSRKNQIYDNEAVLYFDSKEQPIAAYVTSEHAIPEPEKDLLHLFCQNIAMCSDNLSLIKDLNEQAFMDQMTGLPNRNLFVERIKNELKVNAQNKRLVIIDVDHFNSIMETVGTQSCNVLLRGLGHYMISSFKSQDVFVSRIGGDVFGLVGPKEALQVDAIKKTLERPVAVGELLLPVSVTMGLVNLDDMDDYVNAISAGYFALKRAKSTHRGGYYVYNDEMGKEMAHRVDILGRLRSALNAKEFFLVFQPQLDLKNNTIVGFEALIRWQNEQGEFVSPSVFIPIAENAGMISEIGRWVFQSSCQFLRDLLDNGVANAVVSINVSAAQFKEPDFFEFVEESLTIFNIPRNSVDVEITETLAMDDIGNCISMINRLKEIGVQVSLDDFGTGYSSLTYLQRLNVDRLKIDRSFVKEIGESEASERIVKTIVNLGHQLGMEVLAEGVETDEQEQLLCDIGCDCAQGYKYAKPMKYEELTAWLGNRAKNNA